MSPNPLTTVSMRAARWSATHPWRAVFGWLALVVVAVGLAATVPSNEAGDDDYRLGESGVADRWVHEAGLDSPDSEQVLVTADRQTGCARPARGRGGRPPSWPRRPARSRASPRCPSPSGTPTVRRC